MGFRSTIRKLFFAPRHRACGRPWLRRSTRDRLRRGATAVEMAVIAPAFFFLLMGVAELSFMMAAQQMLENAAYNTSRLAKTGFVNNGQSQMQTVSQVLDTELQSFGTFINTANVVMTETAYNTFSNIGSGGTAGLGNPDQIVVYTITYPWQMFTPLIGQIMGTQNAQGQWIYNLTARIVVRNEPF